jgi:hypothetical protein
MIDSHISLPLGEHEWLLQLRWLLHQSGTDMRSLVVAALETHKSPPTIITSGLPSSSISLNMNDGNRHTNGTKPGASTPMVVLSSTRAIQRAYLDFLIFVNTHAHVASEEWRVQWTDATKDQPLHPPPSLVLPPSSTPSLGTTNASVSLTIPTTTTTVETNGRLTVETSTSMSLATVPEDDSATSSPIGTPVVLHNALRVDVEPVAAHIMIRGSPSPLSSPTTESVTSLSQLSSPIPPSPSPPFSPSSSASATPIPLTPNPSSMPTTITNPTPKDDDWSSPLLPSRLFVDSRSAMHQSGQYLHLDSSEGWLLMLLLEHEITLKLLHAQPFGKLQIHSTTLPTLSDEKPTMTLKHHKHHHLAVAMRCYDFHTVLALSFASVLHDLICPRSLFVINAASLDDQRLVAATPDITDIDIEQRNDNKDGGIPLLSLLAAHLAGVPSNDGDGAAWHGDRAWTPQGVRLPWERVIPLSVASLTPRPPSATIRPGTPASLTVAPPTPTPANQQSLVHASTMSSLDGAHPTASVSAVAQRRSRSAQAASSITRLRSTSSATISVTNNGLAASSTIPMGGGGALTSRTGPRMDGNEPDLAARIHAAMMFQPSTPLPAAGRPTRNFVDRLAAAYPPSASITAPPGTTIAPNRSAAYQPVVIKRMHNHSATTDDGRPMSARVHRSNLRSHVMPVDPTFEQKDDTMMDHDGESKRAMPVPPPTRGGQRRVSKSRPTSATSRHQNGLARGLPNTVHTNGVATPSWSTPTFQPKGWMTGLDRSYIPVTARPITVLPHRPTSSDQYHRSFTPQPSSSAHSQQSPLQPTPPSSSPPTATTSSTDRATMPLPDSLPDHYRTPPARTAFYSRSVLLTASEPTLRHSGGEASKLARQWQIQGRPQKPGPASKATLGVALAGLGITDHEYDPSAVHNLNRKNGGSPMTTPIDPGPSTGMTSDGKVARLEELAERRRRRNEEMERRKQKGWSRMWSSNLSTQAPPSNNNDKSQ